MAISGASASWRKKIFSPGMSSMPLGSEPRARMWKLSRQVPRAGWSAASTMRHAWAFVLTWRPPRERLGGCAVSVLVRQLGEPAQLGDGERVVVHGERRDA